MSDPFTEDNSILQHPVQKSGPFYIKSDQMSDTQNVRSRYNKVEMNLILKKKRNVIHFFGFYSSILRQDRHQILLILFLVQVTFNRMKKILMFVLWLEINTIIYKLFSWSLRLYFIFFIH